MATRTRTRKPPEPKPAAPWERQSGESEKVYLQFCVYRDQEHPRSMRRVAASTGKAQRTVEENAQRWRWLARVEAWDRIIDQTRTDEALKRVRRRTSEQLDALEKAQRGFGLVADAVFLRLTELVDSEEGKAALNKMPLPELITMAGVAARAQPRLVEVERLVSGQSTTNLGGHDGGALEKARAEREVDGWSRDTAEAFLAGADAGRLAAERDAQRAAD